MLIFLYMYLDKTVKHNDNHHYPHPPFPPIKNDIMCKYFFYIQVYPGVVDRSPFLRQEMENYFLGGINDMVGWTQRSWNNVVTMLEKGTG